MHLSFTEVPLPEKSSKPLTILGRKPPFCEIRGPRNLLCFPSFYPVFPLQAKAGGHTCVGNITDMLGPANVSLAHQDGMEQLHLKVI